MKNRISIELKHIPDKPGLNVFVSFLEHPGKEGVFFLPADLNMHDIYSLAGAVANAIEELHHDKA